MTDHYPYRTSSYGDWSGIRVEMSTRSDIALQADIDGVTIIVQHPDQWPNSGQFVPSGSQTAIIVKPTYSYTTEDVRRLKPAERQCLNVIKDDLIFEVIYGDLIFRWMSQSLQ